MGFYMSVVDGATNMSYENLYGRLSYSLEFSFRGEVHFFINYFANKDAATPQTVRERKLDSSGNLVLTPDRTDYVYEEVPVARSKYSPVLSTSLIIKDEGLVEALSLRASPIPAPRGGTERERYDPLAQAYRYLHTLPAFASANPDK